MTELTRIPASSLQQRHYTTSEMRKHKYAYETPDGRWRIEYAYGVCGGGWRVVDTTGEHAGCHCCWRSADDHLTTKPTLAAAKAFVSEWAI